MSGRIPVVASPESPFAIRWEGATAWVTIERPKSLNALRGSDEARLGHILETVAHEARVVVLMGSGERAFCAGADIHEVQVEDYASCLLTLQREARLFDTILQARVPVLAAVDGYALGLGAVIAACCDVVIATRAAQFGMPELRNGVPAGMQTQVLVDHIGLARTKWLLYSGKRIDAQQALEWGLIGQVADDRESLIDQARVIAERIESYPAAGVTLQKGFLYSWLQDPLETNARNNPHLAASAYVDDAPAQAVQTFLKGRGRG